VGFKNMLLIESDFYKSTKKNRKTKYYSTFLNLAQGTVTKF